MAGARVVNGNVSQTVERVDGLLETHQLVVHEVIHAVLLIRNGGHVQSQSQTLGVFALLDVRLHFRQFRLIQEHRNADRATNQGREKHVPLPSLQEMVQVEETHGSTLHFSSRRVRGLGDERDIVVIEPEGVVRSRVGRGALVVFQIVVLLEIEFTVTRHLVGVENALIQVILTRTGSRIEGQANILGFGGDRVRHSNTLSLERCPGITALGVKEGEMENDFFLLLWIRATHGERMNRFGHLRAKGIEALSI